MSSTVAVLVDVPNLFFSAKLLHQSKIEYSKLLAGVVGENTLHRAIAYLVQKKDVNGSGFANALQKTGFETRIKEVNSNGADRLDHAHFWNVEVTLDALAMTEKVDTVIIASGDSSYAALAKAIRLTGKRVEIVGFEGATSPSLIENSDKFVPIDSEWIFKEDKFSKAPRKKFDRKKAMDYDNTQPVVAGQPTIHVANTPMEKGILA